MTHLRNLSGIVKYNAGNPLAEVSVPGRQKLTYQGVRMYMEPGFWLRRWTRFPRFYESHNPSIMLRLQRVRPEDAYQGWDERESYFLMELEKRNDVDMDVPLSNGEFSKLAIGEKNHILIKGLYCPHPGNVVLSLAFRKPDGSRDKFPVYSYRVEPESGPWLWGAWLGSIAVTAAVTVGVVKFIGLL